MDSTRFDALTKRIGEARSRRTLLRAALGGMVAAAGLGRAGSGDAAGICREIGSICRKHGDCCSENCAAVDASGRRRCRGACPSPDGYQEGEMVCSSELGFCTKTAGEMVYRACAPGTVCRPFNGSILCDWPTG